MRSNKSHKVISMPCAIYSLSLFISSLLLQFAIPQNSKITSNGQTVLRMIICFMDLKSYVILFNGEFIHMLKSRIALLLTLISSSSVKMMQSIPNSIGIKRSKYKALKNFFTQRYQYSLEHAPRISKYINSYNAENNRQPSDPFEDDWAVIINYPQGQRNLHKQVHNNMEDHIEEECEDILENLNSKKPKKSRRKTKKQRS